jgi:transcriptional regulator GlxA family with amidase domain
MQIAILLFDRFTALDAVGPHEVLSRLPGARAVFVGERVGPVRTDLGTLALPVEATLAEVPRPDIVVVPGGPGQNAYMADGKYVSAAGVSSGIDMALALAGRLAGDAMAQAIQLGIEYDPQPPYHAGSPGKAPREIVAALRANPDSVLR